MRSLSARLTAVVSIAVVLVAGVLIFAADRSRLNDVEGGAAHQLSRSAPPGWSQEFAWVTDLRGSVGELAVAENHVAYLGNDGVLRVLDADSGRAVFTSGQTGSSATAKPFLGMAQGIPVCGVVDGDSLLLWRTDAEPGAAPSRIRLDVNARLFRQGGGLMVSTGREHWVVDPNGLLLEVAVPPDEVALGVTSDGHLLSAPERGWWTIRPVDPRQATRTVRPVTKPHGTVGDMKVAWASRGIVVAWGDTTDPALRTVGLYNASTGALLSGNTLATSALQDGLPLTVSPSAHFASAGPMLVNLDDGQVAIVERWSTIMSDAKQLYGMRDGTRMVWRGGAPVELEPDAVVPWGTSDAGFAIVLDPLRGDRVRLGGLRPA